MSEYLQILSFDNASSYLVFAGIGLGVLIAVFGVVRGATAVSPAAARISASGHVSQNPKSRIVNSEKAKPSGFLATLDPDSEEEKFHARHALEQAGFSGPRAFAGYLLLRVVLGLGLPSILISLVALSRTGFDWVPTPVAAALSGLPQLYLLEALAILAAVGFFGPSFWLNRRIADRKRKIEEAFPNALDLLQISLEAGLAFDAAMLRVAAEISTVAPDLSHEFAVAQNEIQAGRDREKALIDMGRRAGVEEVSSFASAVLQSLEFGTPMADALRVYSEEMRLARELKAQEKANKLPVQMSAVMASTMLPAILMLTLGPVVIRYLNFFAG